MKNHLSAKIRFGFLFLLTIFAFGCGTTVHATNPRGEPQQLETAGASSPAATGQGLSMRVLWTVSEYKAGANATWGKEEADKLLFKPLDMDANSIAFDGKSCPDVIFHKEAVNAKDYLGELFHISPLSLGIKDEVFEVIKTNCRLPGFAEYLRLMDRRLVIHINGVFFYFEPAVNY